MPTETVTIAGKSDPEMGKKRGRIKSDSGMIFQADPSILAAVVVGSKYEVVYKDEAFKDFKYRVVESVNPAMMNNRGQMQPSRQQAAQAAEGYRTGAIQQVTNENRRSEDIATLAIVKEWICRIPVGDIGATVHALKSARAAWLKFKAGGDDRIETGPSLRDEMNDDLPESLGGFPGDR